jgi:hypothetical protein
MISTATKMTGRLAITAKARVHFLFYVHLTRFPREVTLQPLQRKVCG